MPEPAQIDVTIDVDQLTVTVRGRLTSDLIVGVVQKYYISFRGKRILWNVVAADLSHFDDEDFVRIAGAVRDNTPSDLGRRTAYVAANQAAFAVLWRYLNQGIRLHVPVEYQTFTDVAAAQRWLAQS